MRREEKERRVKRMEGRSPKKLIFHDQSSRILSMGSLPHSFMFPHGLLSICPLDEKPFRLDPQEGGQVAEEEWRQREPVQEQRRGVAADEEPRH